MAWQNKLALDFTHSQISYVGHEGTIFHLSGPFAPVIGAENGVVIRSISHLDPPFKMLDNRGARQDGTTWYDAVYDPGEIALVIEVSANSEAEFRKIWSTWWGAWDPRQVGKLCWFSPERGEWWALARMAKPTQDKFDRDFYQSRKAELQWISQNDNAFWFGPPSVCSVSNTQQVKLSDSFQTYFEGGMGPSWTQVSSGGQMTTAGLGTLLWQPSGSTAGSAIARWNGSASDSDDQFVSVTLSGDIPASGDTVQTLTINGNPTGGTFTITYDGETTQPMGPFTSAWIVQLELEALPNIGVGNVNVTGSGWFGLDPYTITFVGDLSGAPVEELTADASSLTYLAGDVPSGALISIETNVVGAHSFVDLWGRMNNSGTVGMYGVRARFGYGTVQLSVVQGGAVYDLWSGTCLPPKAGDKLTLQCGVNSPWQGQLQEFFSGHDWTPTQYQIYANDFPLIPGGLVSQIEQYFGEQFGYMDDSGHSTYGPEYRGVGFGMYAGAADGAQLPPPGISSFDAGVGTPHLTLTNIGDQPAFPSYLCYGPGTFSIGDVGTGNLIQFGPLQAGQIALLNTNPRLAPVVDLTPPPAAVAEKTPQQKWDLATKQFNQWLVDFVTNNNLPPLLEQWQSVFGVTPPLAPVSTLLKSRFTQVVPAMREQEGPMTVTIPCQIQGGSAESKIVASLTPARRWPE